MDKKTLKALKASIKKWKDIADGSGVDKGSDNCALCHLFIDPVDVRGDVCLGCPVFSRTGQQFCTGTTYTSWVKHQTNEHDVSLLDSNYVSSVDPSCAICKQLAETELIFLESLLPEGKR